MMKLYSHCVRKDMVCISTLQREICLNKYKAWNYESRMTQSSTALWFCVATVTFLGLDVISNMICGFIQKIWKCVPTPTIWLFKSSKICQLIQIMVQCPLSTVIRKLNQTLFKYFTYKWCNISLLTKYVLDRIAETVTFLVGCNDIVFWNVLNILKNQWSHNTFSMWNSCE
jgi:hypothetical protein